MQELRNLSIIFTVGVVGVVISIGGGIYTAVQAKKERLEQTLPTQAIPVPATYN